MIKAYKTFDDLVFDHIQMEVSSRKAARLVVDNGVIIVVVENGPLKLSSTTYLLAIYSGKGEVCYDKLVCPTEDDVTKYMIRAQNMVRIMGNDYAIPNE